MDTVKINLKKVVGMSCAVGIAGGALVGQLDASLLLVQSLQYQTAFTSIVVLLASGACTYAVLGGFIMATLGAGSFWALSMTTKRMYQNHIPGILAGLLCAVIVSVSVASGPLKQRFIEAAFILFPLGLCVTVGIVFLVTWLIERLHNKLFVLPGLLLLVVWLVLLANGFWLLFLNNDALREMSVVVRIIVNVILFASLAILFISLINIWGSLMHKRKIYVKRLITVLSLLLIILFVSEWIVDAYAKKNSVMFSSSTTPTAKKSAMPNILWIVMDTVRADHLSCYGYHHSTTPYIDRIALEGVVFDNAFSTAPWTLPAHASMLTGMYPSKHQTTNNHQFLSNRFTTIAELLRANGYKTAAFTNNGWFSPMTNLNQGFDFFFEGYTRASADNLWIEFFISRWIFRLLSLEKKIINRFTDWKSARQTNTQIEKWLKKKWNYDAPFFMFINYMEAHTPLNPPESYARPFLPSTISYNKAMQVNQDIWLYYSGLVAMNESDFNVFNALYDAQINQLDHYIANLFDLFRSMHILDNTIIIITSDHGENIGENKKMGHVFSVDDRLLHVPLIIRYPKNVPAGQRISRPVQIHQIFPTILDLIGLSWNKRNDLQGDSLFQETPSSNAPASMSFAELGVFYEEIQLISQYNRNCFVDDYARSFKTIRDQQYKYIMASDGRDELYDIVKDPGETRNLSKENSIRAKELRLRLDALLRSFKIPDLKKTDTEIVDAAKHKGAMEALKSLGYVQ